MGAIPSLQSELLLRGWGRGIAGNRRHGSGTEGQERQRKVISKTVGSLGLSTGMADSETQ